MARKPRLHIPGALYHVMLRGNDGQPIFFDSKDHNRFLNLMSEGVDRFGHRIHAYCLMDNHVHILIQIGQIPLSRIMQNVSFRYTLWINKRHSRIGHLFQGRFRAILCDGDSYLLELIRYIHLNPVRAGLVDLPEDFQWSSHRAYLGVDSISWLTTDWCLSQFSAGLESARERYAKFVIGALNMDRQPDLYEAKASGRVLGEDEFVESVLSQADESSGKREPLDRIISSVCKVFGVAEEELHAVGRKRLHSRLRGVIGLLVQEIGNCGLTAVADRFGRDLSSISRNVAVVRNYIKEDETFDQMYMEAKFNAISQA